MAPVERRAAALLARLLARSRTPPAALAAELGIPPREIERLLAGDGPLDLAKLERVLEALDVLPGEFFARLYGQTEILEEERQEDLGKAEEAAGDGGARPPSGGRAVRGGPPWEALATGAGGTAAAASSSSLPSSSSTGLPSTAGGPAPPRPPADPPLDRLEVEAALGAVRSMVDGMIRRLDAEETLERERGAPTGAD